MPVNVVEPAPAENCREDRYTGVVLVNVRVLGAIWEIFVFVMVCEFNPDAVTNMILAKDVPVKGTGELGVEVTNKMFPGPEAKILLTGDPTLPVGDNAESDKVQPLVLFPEIIRVPLPFMYCPILNAGVPLVILSIFPLMYPPVTNVFVPETNPVNVAWFEMVPPVISILEGFVI